MQYESDIYSELYEEWSLIEERRHIYWYELELHRRCSMNYYMWWYKYDEYILNKDDLSLVIKEYNKSVEDMILFKRKCISILWEEEFQKFNRSLRVNIVKGLARDLSHKAKNLIFI